MIERWFFYLQTVTHQSSLLTRPGVNRATSLIGHNVLVLGLPLRHATNLFSCEDTQQLSASFQPISDHRLTNNPITTENKHK